MAWHLPVPPSLFRLSFPPQCLSVRTLQSLSPAICTSNRSLLYEMPEHCGWVFLSNTTVYSPLESDVQPLNWGHFWLSSLKDAEPG